MGGSDVHIQSNTKLPSGWGMSLYLSVRVGNTTQVRFELKINITSGIG